MKWYGKYGRKASRIVKRFGKYGRKASRIVKRFGKYRWKLWKDMKNMENMEEKYLFYKTCNLFKFTLCSTEPWRLFNDWYISALQVCGHSQILVNSWLWNTASNKNWSDINIWGI